MAASCHAAQRSMIENSAPSLYCSWLQFKLMSASCCLETLTALCPCKYGAISNHNALLFKYSFQRGCPSPYTYTFYNRERRGLLISLTVATQTVLPLSDRQNKNWCAASAVELRMTTKLLSLGLCVEIDQCRIISITMVTFLGRVT